MNRKASLGKHGIGDTAYAEIRRLVRKTPSAQMAVIGLIGILATLFAASGIMKHSEQMALYQLRDTAQEVLVDFDNALQETFSSALFLKSFYDASQVVDRKEFKLYTRALLQSRSSILALEWIPIVSEKNRLSYEESMRQEGYPEFKIQEMGEDLKLMPMKTREVYYPISFVEPEEEHASLLGINLGAEENRLATFQKACAAEAMTISPLFPLLQATNAQGFFVAAPLIRDQKCQGLVLSVFKLDVITKHILEKHKQTERFIFVVAEEVASDKTAEREGVVVREIKFGEHLWRAEIRFDPKAVKVAPGIKFWGSLAFGFGLTALLLLYLQLLMRYSDEVEATVLERTRELENTKTVLENEIDENVKTQELLVKTEASYRQILDAITDMVLVKGPKSKIMWANQAFCNYYGMNRKELQNLIDAPFNSPDFTKQYIQDDEEVFNSGIPLDVNSEPVTRYDGAVGFFHTLKSPIFDKEGKVIQTVGVSRDISDRLKKDEALQKALQELRRSEEQFRGFVGNIPGAIYRCAADEAWTMEFISENIQALSGYPASEFIQNRVRTYASVIHPEDRAMFEEKVSKAIEGKKAYTLEYRICHAEGSIRWVYEKGQGVFSEKGELLCLDGGIFDITERKHWENKIQETQKLDAVGKLAGGIAHDFNNQLMVISGYCTLLLGEMPQGSVMHSQMLDIKRAAEKSSQLTRQLLALGRKQLTAPEIFDPSQVLQKMAGMIQTLMGVKIELRLELEEALMPVLMDKQQFEQVIMNLVINACDAMPRGGKLTVRTFSQKKGDSEAFTRIEVQDTGTGMSAEAKAHLFEPFFTTKDRSKGSGLGLATCYAMVTTVGGRIEVESELGQGTLWRIFLPQVKKNADEKILTKEAAALPKKNGCILLTDDDAAVRKVVSAILTAQGYTVLEASGGEEALQIVKRERSAVDLLITDIMMPGMDGCELVRRFKGICPESLTLFISGYAGQFSPEEFKSTPLLEKPFNPDVLLKKVSEILEAKKKRLFS